MVASLHAPSVGLPLVCESLRRCAAFLQALMVQGLEVQALRAQALRVQGLRVQALAVQGLCCGPSPSAAILVQVVQRTIAV